VGREARCFARWGTKSGQVTVLIEPPELIARGAFTARASLASLTDVRAENGTVQCSVGADDIVLELGATLAPRWAIALVAGPPSLAKKLGLAPSVRALVIGSIDDDQLGKALAEAIPARDAASSDVIVLRTDDAAELEAVLSRHAEVLQRGVPLWTVYVKGKGAPLGETAVRAILRERGFVDRKIAGVSPRLTALQFTRR
jgi:hypothetical protein